jgi:hypothetical protein
VDLIESGPEPPARAGAAAAVWTWAGRRRTPAPPEPAPPEPAPPEPAPPEPGRAEPGRPRRLGAIAATALLSIGLLVGLRAGVAEPVATFSSVSLPPYDTLPGRVRVPTPRQGSEDGEVVIGGLPMFSVLDTGTAEQATRIVLGRYCLHPERLIAHAGRDAGRYSAPVIVSDDDNGGRYLATIIVYADRADPSRLYWRGWLAQLHRCG